LDKITHALLIFFVTEISRSTNTRHFESGPVLMNVNKYGGLKKRARVLPRHYNALIRDERLEGKALSLSSPLISHQMESAHRCTGLLFITARISHLTPRNRTIGRSLAAHRNQFGEYKNGSFSSPNCEYLLHFCVQGRTTIHVQGRLNNDVIVREYFASGYFSNLSNVSLNS